MRSGGTIALAFLCLLPSVAVRGGVKAVPSSPVKASAVERAASECRPFWTTGESVKPGETVKPSSAVCSGSAYEPYRLAVRVDSGVIPRSVILAFRPAERETAYAVEPWYMPTLRPAERETAYAVEPWYMPTLRPAERETACAVAPWYMWNYCGALYGISSGIWAASVKAKWLVDHGMPEKAELMREYVERAMEEDAYGTIGTNMEERE